MQAESRTGPIIAGDGAINALRSDRTGATVITDGHGRFHEPNYRGSLFSAGSGVTALSANTISLTNSTTPIVGVWNPSNATVNLVILQIAVNVFANTLTTPVGCGALVLASSVGNTAISTGAAPFNRRTLASSGSSAKAFNGGVALTGLTNNLVIFDGLEIPSSGPLTYSTTTAMQLSGAGVVNVDGSIIVPPGGVLALLNTTSTTTASAVSRMLWEEVPV
jgi:hypothetical protein